MSKFMSLSKIEFVSFIYQNHRNPNIFVTGSAKRGLIAFLNFQLQFVATHSVFSLLM